MTGRFDLFYSLEQEKQTRIIHAAMNEFAEKGFKRASTNNIIEKAGISKGMLFYYFGNKEELFDFLCEYTIEFGKNTYLKKFTAETGDFLERYRLLTEIKRKALSEFPVIIKFLESLYVIREEHFIKFQKAAGELKDSLRKNMYDGIDYSLFSESIDPRNTAKYIKWLMDSYEADVTARLKDGSFNMDDKEALSGEWERFYCFINDLRKIFYK